MVNGAQLEIPRIDQIPPAPRLPSPLARQLVFGYGGGQGVARLVGMGFLAIGLLLSVIFWWGLPVDVAIALSPAETTGTVLTARWNWNATYSGVHPATVRYAYEVDGVRREGGYDALIPPPQAGDAITIEYSRALPGWSRIAGTRRGWTPWFVAAFVAAFPLFGLALIIHVARANRREIRAFTYGRPVLARVTYRGLDPTTQINGRNPFMIRWEFRGPAGDVFEGSLTSMKLLELEPYGQAEEVVVLHDPDDPRRNTLYVA